MRKLLIWIILLFSSFATFAEVGVASFYAEKFNGRKTANGEIYNSSRLTTAHRTLPFGTLVCIQNLSNGETTKVRVNDRGPFIKGRTFDLSRSAALQLNMIKSGHTRVEYSICQ